MFTITALTAILFYAVSFATTTHLLFQTSYKHAVLIVGFYLLARVSRLWNELLVEQKRGEYLAKFQEELAKRQESSQTETTSNVVNN